MTNLIDNEKIDVGFNELDMAMEKIVNEHKRWVCVILV